jgi:hypothetical protein
MSELLPAGNYKGKILDYGVKRTSKGDPAPTIAFELENGSKVFWQGSWNGGGLDISMEALLRCGLQNPSRLMHLAEGKASGLLDLSILFDLEIEVNVADTPNEDGTRKKWNRVKWINVAGSSKFKDAITVQEFAPALNERNLVAELMRVAAEKGYNMNSNLVRQTSVEIPF